MIQNSLIFFQDATGRSTLQFDATRKSASQNLMNSIYLYLYLYIYYIYMYVYISELLNLLLQVSRYYDHQVNMNDA